MEPLSPRQLEDEQRLAERAAEWLIVLKSPTAAEHREFADWLAESPRHLEEFLLTTALDRQLNRLDWDNNDALQSLLVQAQTKAAVVRLSTPARTGRPALVRQRRRWITAVAATLAAICVAGGMSSLVGETYGTDVDEERMIKLNDGSVMQLEPHSRARVRFSASRRDIRLMEGEALFTVAPDASRPFYVHSAESTIQALGTQFYVLQRPSGTTVSVLEGAVQINAATKLVAGQEVRVAEGGRIEPPTVLDAVMTAQRRQHRLIFHNDTLTDIAAEFNRYNRSPRIVLHGDMDRAPRYTGVFDANDPGSLLLFLRDDPEISVQELQDKLIIRAK